MNIHEYIEQNKVMIDNVLRQRLPKFFAKHPITHDIRRQWVLNDIELFNTAQADGVDFSA